MQEQEIPPVEALMQALQFSPQDLDANRAGKLGAQQRKRLQTRQNRAALIGLSGFIVFALLATTFLFIGQQNAAFIFTLMGMAITIVNALFVGIFARQWMRLRVDLRDGAVEIISGTMERVVRAHGRVHNFVLRMDHAQFSVKKELFNLFRHKVSYRLYRTPHSKVLLAAEPLR